MCQKRKNNPNLVYVQKTACSTVETLEHARPPSTWLTIEANNVENTK